MQALAITSACFVIFQSGGSFRRSGIKFIELLPCFLVIRLESERFLKLHSGLTAPSSFREDRSQVAMHLGKAGGQPEGFLVLLDCLIKPALHGQHVAEIEMSPGVVRIVMK